MSKAKDSEKPASTHGEGATETYRTVCAWPEFRRACALVINRREPFKSLLVWGLSERGVRWCMEYLYGADWACEVPMRDERAS